MYYLNHNIENLVRIFDQNERKGYLRLDLNENPGGLPQEFAETVLAEVTPQMIAQYPENTALHSRCWQIILEQISLVFVLQTVQQKLFVM